MLYGADKASTTSRTSLKRLLLECVDGTVAAVAQAINDVEAAAGATELRQVHQAVVDKLQEAVARLATARDQLTIRDIARPFRVVLMGRTMAGKSTLFEYLSGGDGARVGTGLQGTSHDVCVRRISAIGVEIADTPGVGGMDLEADYQTAFSAVADADLILWVATDQATQEQTGRALERLSDLGKPILVALNCLADVSDEINLLDMLEEPERIFGGDAEGNLAPVRRHLSRAGGRYIDAIPIHAQAALLAISSKLTEEDARTLHRNSRIDSLVSAFRHQADATAELRRIVSVCDFLRVGLLEAASTLSSATLIASSALAASRGSQQDFHKRAQRRVEDAHEELRAAFAVAVTNRERWIEKVDVDRSGKEINELWDREVATLRGELVRSATDIGVRLEGDLKGIAVDVADDWSHVDSGDFHHLGGRGAIWGNRAVKVGGRVAAGLGGLALGAKIGAIVGTALGPGLGNAIGAVVGAIIGLVSGLLGLYQAIDWLGDRIFRSPAEVRERRRRKVRAQLSPLLKELGERMEAAGVDARRAWLDAIDNELAKQSASGDALERVLAVIDRVNTGSLESALTRVDTELARELMRNLGRDRAASAVVRATRWRGAGIAVELTEPAFSELVLFPTIDSVERILPTAVQAPTWASALQVVRSLTDREVTVYQMEPESLLLALGSPVTSGVREAWGALAQAHTGVRVRIKDTVEGDVQ